MSNAAQSHWNHLLFPHIEQLHLPPIGLVSIWKNAIGIQIRSHIPAVKIANTKCISQLISLLFRK